MIWFRRPSRAWYGLGGAIWNHGTGAESLSAESLCRQVQLVRSSMHLQIAEVLAILPKFGSLMRWIPVPSTQNRSSPEKKAEESIQELQIPMGFCLCFDSTKHVDGPNREAMKHQHALSGRLSNKVSPPAEMAQRLRPSLLQNPLCT